MTEEELVKAIQSQGWLVGGRIGKGGQGSVYKARRESESTTYAMKVMLSERPRAAERFAREIEAVRKLDHPSIVRIIDQAKPDFPISFYVMEYHEGASPLKAQIASPTNPYFSKPEKSLRLYIKLLDALRACEEKGIVHRDLSLGNILLRPNEQLLLIDFGCCYTDDGRRITYTNESIGTRNFMAPECEGADSASPSIRADLYSAGKILWCLVTNRFAFPREDPVFNNLSLREVLPDEPMACHLDHIFTKTIRRHPAERYKTVEEAIGDAHRVMRLIKLGFPPLESLEHGMCHVCGIGRLEAMNGSQNPIIQGAREQMAKLLPNLGIFLHVCDQCGNCSFRVGGVVHQQLEEKRQLH